MMKPLPKAKSGNVEAKAAIIKPPRWVIVFVIVLVASLALAGGLILFGGGQHGPGRHFRAVPEQHQQP